MKKILFSLVLFLMIGVVTFLVAEFFFRAFDHQRNPLVDTVQKQRQYLFTPGLNVRSQSSVAGEYDYTATINALGDSFTFGVGAADDQTIPAVLEQALRKKNINAEVINAGIGHASPITHYVNLRDIHLAYAPDMVVLFLDLTDLWDDWHSERNAVYDKAGEIRYFDPTVINGKRDWWIVANQHSKFCQWINAKVVRLFKKMTEMGPVEYFKALSNGKRAKAVIINSARVSDDVQLSYDGLLMMRGREKKDLIDAQWVRTARYLTKIRDLLAARQIPLIIVMYPHGIYVGADQWSQGRETWGFEKGKVYTDHYAFELVADYARAAGIPFISTVPSFLAAPKEKYFFDWDGHMTPAGYRLTAQSVFADPVFRQGLSRFMPYLLWEE